MHQKESPQERFDREKRRELRRATRWLRRNDVGSLPGKRLANGESATKERSSLLTGRANSDHDSVGLRESRTHHMTSLDALDSMERLELSQWFEPLIGRMPGQPSHLTMDDLERRLRLEHVMTYLLPAHIELLLMRHAERRTLDSIAGDFSVTRQAIIKRLQTAEQDFRKHYGVHYWDPMDPASETTRDALDG